MLNMPAPPALWRIAAAWPLSALALLVALQHLPGIFVYDLWFSDVARHGGVLREVTENGNWLALRLNGYLYPDKPPVYFWYLAGLAWLFGSTAPWVIYLGLAGTVWMMLAATHRMTLRLIGSRDLALAAALILSSGYYFLGVSHYARMDMMFAAAITLSWMHVYLGTGPEGALRRGSILAVFGWAAVAAMIKGPVGVMLPLLALIGWLVATRRAGRLLDRSITLGMAILLAVIGAWAVGIIAQEGHGYFAALFQGQIVDRGLNHAPWLGYARYLVTLPLTFLPWTILVAFAGRWTGPVPRYLALVAGLGFLGLSLVAEKHEYYLVPLFVPLSVLAAGWYGQASARGRVRFWIVTGIAALALGAVFLVATAMATGLLAWPVDPGDYADMLGTTWAPGLVLLGSGALALGLRHRAWEALGLFAVVQAVLISVVVLASFPRANAILSPRTVAQAVTARAGGRPVGIWHGGDRVFYYHLGFRYPDMSSAAELWDWLDARPEAVAALTMTEWNLRDRTPKGVAPVDCVPFVGTAIVIVVKPPEPAVRDLSRCGIEEP